MNIIAHRGDSTGARDNTMEAFQLAYEADVYGFEFDVRLSADSIPVIYHNMMLNGATQDGFIEDFTFDQLKSIKLLHEDKTYHIPSLQEVLDTYCGKTYLEIHVQSNNRDIVPAIANLLNPFRHHRDMIELTSYEPAILLAFQEACPGIACDLLFYVEAWMTQEIVVRLMLDKAVLASAKGVHLPRSQVTRDAVERFTSKGFTVHCGLVNNIEALNHIQANGIHQFCTDNIHLFI